MAQEPTNAVLFEQLKTVTKQLAVQNEILLGNGDTSKSLVVQFATLQKSVSDCQQLHKDRVETKRFSTTTWLAIGAGTIEAIALLAVIFGG